jgi:hypothetical protein
VKVADAHHLVQLAIGFLRSVWLGIRMQKQQFCELGSAIKVRAELGFAPST